MDESRGFKARYSHHTEGKEGVAFTGAVASFVLAEMMRAVIGFITLQFFKYGWDNFKKWWNGEEKS